MTEPTRPMVRAPESVRVFQDFLIWWLGILNTRPSEPLHVDCGRMPLSLKQAAVSVVMACNHAVIDFNSSEARRSLDPTCVITETIFIDTETDEIRCRNFLVKYRRLIESVSRQAAVQRAQHIHITHCSIDKAEQVIGLSHLINAANRRSEFSKQILGLYAHPDEWYDIPENPTIDEERLPNKTQDDRVRSNFERAIASFGMETNLVSGLYLRGAIDDDDLWMPWAIEELVYQACKYLEQPGSDLRVMAIGNQYIYYPYGCGRLDLADMRAVLNGSKVYVSETWDRVAEVSPWSLTEIYASNRLNFYNRRGITARITHNARAVLVYVRGTGNFTGISKENLYLSPARVLENVGSEEFAIEAGILLDREYHVRGEPVFELDLPTFEVRSLPIELEGHSFTSNYPEYISSRGLDSREVQIVVSALYPSGRFVRAYSTFDDILLPPGELLRAPLFELRDLSDRRIDITWAR